MDRSTYLNETHTRKLEHTYILEVTFWVQKECL
jgi:hypothetical protein